jgi:hypothetical protein
MDKLRFFNRNLGARGRAFLAVFVTALIAHIPAPVALGGANADRTSPVAAV